MIASWRKTGRMPALLIETVRRIRRDDRVKGPGEFIRETVRRITEKGSGESPERLLVETVRWIERQAFG